MWLEEYNINKSSETGFKWINLQMYMHFEAKKN